MTTAVLDAITREFDSSYYVDKYPDIAASDIQPLQHYITRGIAENRWPNRWFDPHFYAARQEVLHEFGPFGHYLETGRMEGSIPSNEFRDYLNPRIRIFVKWLFSRFMNRTFYHAVSSARQPDTTRSTLDRLYIDKKLEQASPLPKFSPDVYRLALPSSATRGWHLFHLYLVRELLDGTSQLQMYDQFLDVTNFSNPAYEGLQQLISPDFYWEYNTLSPHDVPDPCRHYVESGWLRAFDPSPQFSTEYYLAQHDDVARAGANPLWHYMAHGSKERRTAQVRAPDRSGHQESTILRQLLEKLFANGGRVQSTPQTTAVEYRSDVTIIVPVHGAKNHVEVLLRTLCDTVDPNQPIIVIDDFSDDADLTQLLQDWTKKRAGATLVSLSHNVGFGAACNMGLARAPGHAIVVNTDTMPPPGWLSRIMAPIDRDPTVASVTPYSNTSSVTGFPSQQSEGPPYLGLDLGLIDTIFSALPETPTDLVTGSGFFMAMSKNALAAVPQFDTTTFGRGYYEDTDWCVRAVNLGFRNVLAPYLFVIHDTESPSFSKSERVRMSSRNRILFDRKHPAYQGMLRAELANDPHAGYRKAARIGCWMLACATSVVFLEHGWGGGAEAAVSDAVEQASHSGACCIRLRAIKSGVRIEFVFGDESEVFDSVPPDLVLKLIAAIRPASLEIHGLHSMSAPHATLREILASLTARTRVDIFLHDFFVVCPSQHLINWRGSYCGVPDISICNICLPRNPNVSTYAPSLNRWRKSWKELFERVDSVIVFDESAIPILKSAFRAEELPMIVIRPPAYEAPSPGAIRQEAGALRRIAFCGAVLHHKGAAVVRALADYVFDHGLDIKLVLIGELLDGKPPPHNLEITGQYESRRLVNILSEQEINIVVFPSICPETFSFTLSEIFASGLPCVGLDIGAQGHRLREYPKGIVLPNLAPKPLLDAMEVYFAKNEK